MPIEVRCSCGKLLQANDEWTGRRARCPKCQEALTIPDRPSAPVASGGFDDFLSEEVSSRPAAPTSAPPSPPEVERPGRKSKRGWFSWLFWEFPSFGSSLKWKEPYWYPVRLRGDVLRRFAVVLAVWAGATGGFLVAFAGNANSPGIGLGIGLGTIFAAFAVLAVFFRLDHVAGRVRFGETQIYRNRDFNKLLSRRHWTEWAEWPYAAIDRCVIVPADSLGKSFSVMLLWLGSERERVGIPQSIDLERVRRHLKAMGVTIEYGRAIPAEYTEPMERKIPIVAGAIGAAVLLVGLGFHADKVGGLAPQQAAAEEEREAEPAGLGEGPERLPNDAPRFLPGDPQLRNAAERLSPLGRRGRQAGEQPSEDATAAPDRSKPPTTPPPASGTSGTGGNPFGVPAGRPDQGMRPPGIPPFQFPGTEPAQPADRATRQPQPGPAIGRPPRPAVSSRPLQPGDTELVGGPGGGPFRSENPDGKPVLGFRYTLGRWMGWTAPRSMEPLYDRAQADGAGQTVLAREGYAVGAIQVDVDQFVTAVQVVFMRLSPDGRLDKTDSYTSDWIGEPSEKPPQTLGGTGAPVLGVYGRKAAVLDAVGLMLQGD